VQRYRQAHVEVMERFELAPILHSLSRSIACLAPQVSVEVKMSAPDVAMHGSRIELEQVLMNLCLNAVHAMPDEGTLRIEVKAMEPEGHELVLEDSGVGISKENLSRIFDPFFTTKKEDGGTGIGLANVRDIVERWGGAIHVQSQVGQGTRFGIALPTL